MTPDPRDTGMIHPGIEIELLVSGPNVAVSSWRGAAECIAGLMAKAGVDTEVVEKVDEFPVRWAVATDGPLSDSRYKDDPLFIRSDESTLSHPILPLPKNLC